MTTRGRTIFITLIVAAFLIGLFIIPANGIHEPPTAPATPSASYPVKAELPPMEEEEAGVHAATACATNPGNPYGYCWYSGYRWPSNWICIDSSIPGHPLGAVATLFRAIDSRLKVSAYNGAGQCKAHGFPRNRYVTFIPFTAAERAASPGACGLYFAPSYGAYNLNNSITYNRPLIKIHVSGYQRTPCGGGLEWRDVFAHELGHGYGLSHNQPRSTSILRQGHVLDAYDKYHIKMISGFYPTVTRKQIP
jgi:hypothetical protein